MDMIINAWRELVKDSLMCQERSGSEETVLSWGNCFGGFARVLNLSRLELPGLYSAMMQPMLWRVATLAYAKANVTL